MNLIFIHVVPIFIYKYSMPIIKYIVVDNIIPTMISLSGKGIKSIYNRLTNTRIEKDEIDENWICL